MEPSVQIALIGAVAATIAGLMAAFVSIRNATKLESIDKSTNSHLSKVTEELKRSNDANLALERLIVMMTREKAQTASVQQAADVREALRTPSPTTEG